MEKIIKDFKAKMRNDGRSYKWFHRTYLNGISYPYFIVQLNEPDRLQDAIKKPIENYLNNKK